MPNLSLPHKKDLIFPAIVACVYSAFFSIVCFLKYRFFIYDDFDLAVHSQSLGNLLKGSFFSSILGFNFLGNHFQPILFALLPVYAFVPHPVTLLVVQSCALGLGVLPVYILAHRKLGRTFGIVFALAYVLNPALSHLNLFEFHPVSFTVPLLLTAWLFFEERRFNAYISMLCLALLCKENAALLLIMFGVYAMIRRCSLKWVLTPLLMGIVWFTVIIGFIMPRLNAGYIDYTLLYHHLGATPLEWFRTLFSHPMATARFLLMPEKLNFLRELFSPLGYISLLSPLPLLVSLPIFAQRFLTWRTTEFCIRFHYAALLLPFIVVAAIDGMVRLTRIPAMNTRFIKRMLGAGLIAVACMGLVSFGVYPRLREEFSMVRDHGRVRLMQWFCDQVPATSACAASFEFLPHLADTHPLYSFHHIYTGQHTLSRKPYVLPDNVNYALVNFMDRNLLSSFFTPESSMRLRAFLKDGPWGIAAAYENIFLLKKDRPDEFLPLEIFPYDKSKNIRSYAMYADNFTLCDYDIKPASQDGFALLECSFTWRAKRTIDVLFLMRLAVVDGEGNIVREVLHPLGYGIYPTYEWKPDECVRDHFKLLLPSRLSDGPYHLRVGLLSAVMRIPLAVEPSSECPLQTISGQMLDLGELDL